MYLIVNTVRTVNDVTDKELRKLPGVFLELPGGILGSSFGLTCVFWGVLCWGFLGGLPEGYLGGLLWNLHGNRPKGLSESFYWKFPDSHLRIIRL